MIFLLSPNPKVPLYTPLDTFSRIKDEKWNKLTSLIGKGANQ